MENVVVTTKTGSSLILRTWPRCLESLACRLSLGDGRDAYGNDDQQIEGG